jgi:protein-tyrosine phosphatase
VLKALGIRSVIDLRYPWEIAAAGRAPHDDEVGYLNLSIEHRPYEQTSLDPSIAVVPYLADRFAEVMTDGVDEIRATLQAIATDDRRPLVFHCASGKDRTGIVAALVLSLLGVDENDIVDDFARTEQVRDQLRADWSATHPGRQITWPGYGRTPPELMWRFLSDVASSYGSVRDYVAESLGLDADFVAELQRSLLEPASNDSSRHS